MPYTLSISNLADEVDKGCGRTHVVMRDRIVLVCLVQRRRGLQMTRVHLPAVSDRRQNVSSSFTGS